MSESFVPIEDLAKHFSVSISTVRAWVRQKHIPEDTYIKVGSTYRFRVSDVESALTKVNTREDVSNDLEVAATPQTVEVEVEEDQMEFDLDEDV
jgi:excisionase family DNA binding protein